MPKRTAIMVLVTAFASLVFAFANPAHATTTPDPTTTPVVTVADTTTGPTTGTGAPSGTDTAVTTPATTPATTNPEPTTDPTVPTGDDTTPPSVTTPPVTEPPTTEPPTTGPPATDEPVTTDPAPTPVVTYPDPSINPPGSPTSPDKPVTEPPTTTIVPEPTTEPPTTEPCVNFDVNQLVRSATRSGNTVTVAMGAYPNLCKLPLMWVPSYQMFNDWDEFGGIPQNLFGQDGPKFVSDQSQTFSVTIPSCAAQVDLVMESPLQHVGGGTGSYHARGTFVDRWYFNTPNWCPQRSMSFTPSGASNCKGELTDLYVTVTGNFGADEEVNIGIPKAILQTGKGPGLYHIVVTGKGLKVTEDGLPIVVTVGRDLYSTVQLMPDMVTEPSAKDCETKPVMEGARDCANAISVHNKGVKDWEVTIYHDYFIGIATKVVAAGETWVYTGYTGTDVVMVGNGSYADLVGQLVYPGECPQPNPTAQAAGEVLCGQTQAVFPLSNPGGGMVAAFDVEVMNTGADMSSPYDDTLIAHDFPDVLPNETFNYTVALPLDGSMVQVTILSNGKSVIDPQLVQFTACPIAETPPDTGTPPADNPPNLFKQPPANKPPMLAETGASTWDIVLFGVKYLLLPGAALVLIARRRKGLTPA